MKTPPKVKSYTQKNNLNLNLNKGMTQPSEAKSLTMAKPSKPPQDEFETIEFSLKDQFYV